MKNIKHVVVAAVVFSSGVFLGVTGFDAAVAANNKTYKVVYFDAYNFDIEKEFEPLLNEMAANGWTLVQGSEFNAIFSK